MKSLRLLLCLMAVSTVSVFPSRALAQQEVDPDHFDQSPAKVSYSKPHAPALKAVSTRHHSQAGHARVASKSHHAATHTSG